MEEEKDYKYRMAMSTSTGEKQEDGTWKVITTVVEGRMENKDDEWDTVELSAATESPSFEEGQRASAFALYQQLAGLGLDTSSSLFDMRSGDELVN